MDVYRWRWAVCSLIFIFLCISDPTYSQTVTNKLEKAVTFSTRTVRLDTLLQTITRQTGIRFSYNSRRLNTSYRIHLNNTESTVRQLLDKLKTVTGVLYTVIENQVILNIDKSTVQRPVKPELKSPAKQPQPARSLRPATQMQVQDSGKQIKPEPPTTQDSLFKPADSTSVTSGSLLTKDIVANATIPLSDSVSSLKSNSSGIAKSKIDSVQKKESLPAVKKISSSKKQNYFLDLGVSAEETLFMGATLQGGIPAIFATLSVKSNGRSVILLYGLGASIRIKNKSRIMLTAQYGSCSKSFVHTEAGGDSTSASVYQIGVKGRLARAGVGIEWKLNTKGNWKFHAWLNYNALQSRYTVDGTDSGLSGIPVADPERKFSAFYPFYTITNSFEDTASETLKTWVGIQVGINFTIFQR